MWDTDRATFVGLFTITTRAPHGRCLTPSTVQVRHEAGARDRLATNLGVVSSVHKSRAGQEKSEDAGVCLSFIASRNLCGELCPQGRGPGPDGTKALRSGDEGP